MSKSTKVREIDIRIPATLLDSSAAHRKEIAGKLKIQASEIKDLRLLKRSIDARGKTPYYLLRFAYSLGEKLPAPERFALQLSDVSKAPPALVVGFGPAGMFAALKLIELGIKPIVLERGKSVRERRHDIAAINKKGIVDPDSNYCFGEGGAGTFSDGKLYTRSTKRGSVERVLHILVAHGASEDILIEAHPHIGTNKLPALVQEIRKTIIAHGGEVHFQSRVVELLRSADGMKGVRLSSGEKIEAHAVLLATGHSARDVFELLQRADISIEHKPFALGVRVEHPQLLIDQIQYHGATRAPELPAASYSLTHKSAGRGVFSFCMCPGGIICPAATENDEIVVNGWSPSKRNSVFANSGIVVEVREEDLRPFRQLGALAGVGLQQSIEKQAFVLGGGKQKAPAQRLTDFLSNKSSQNLPKSSYLPGLHASELKSLFPKAFYEHLVAGFQAFGKQRKGYVTKDAVVVAVESRTSSPIKVPRDKEHGMHPELRGMFPVGEGAGYAGGIMSAAMDGENAAIAVAQYYKR